MLPALDHLALRDAATGVTVNSDGSATVTREEWALIARVMAMPLFAPVPTPNRLPLRVRHDDDSSEDERAPAPAPTPAPAPPPPPPPPSQRRRLARPATSYDDADAISDLLKADELAAILGAIGLSDGSKSSACQDALAWCVLNTEHKAMCDSHPLIWQGLGERIFKQEEVGAADDALLGKGLIYRTFRDDDHPKRAFERMCGAKGLGDVLAKRFVMSTVGKYDETLWDQWDDNRAEVTGLGEEIEDLSMDEIEKLQVQYYPDIGKTNDWEADAKALFNSSPSKAIYLDKYRNDEIFSKLVNVLFKSTQKYLFQDDKAIDNINETNRNEPVLEAINEIGEVLGVYIVCLWQLEHDLDKINTETEHNGRYEGGWLDMRIDQMQVEIQNLRVKVFHAVNTVLNPDTAGTIYSNVTDYEDELHDYESVSDADSD